MKHKINYSKYLALSVLIIFIGTVYAISITDISNYSNPFTTSNSSILFNYNLTTDNLNNLTCSFNNRYVYN